MSQTQPPNDVNQDVAIKPSPFSSSHVSVKWLLVLAILYTLYFSKALVVPIVLAMLVSLLLSPVVTVCKVVRIPRSVSAAILIAVLTGPFILLSIELAAPAQKWMSRLPQLSAEITEELNVLGRTIVGDPVDGHTGTDAAPVEAKKFDFWGWFKSDAERAPRVKPEKNILVEEVKKGGVEVLLATLSATPGVFAQLSIFLVLLLFILIFGPSLYNNLVETLPFIRDKRQAALLVGGVRKQLSRYMLTVSLINAALGAATALTLSALGMEDALLWGVLVGLLNFAPYIGPIVGIVTLIIAGVAQYGLDSAALVPASLFFGLNLVEAQFITPTALGKHMRLNPLILILWLLIWGWIWGAAGVLLAVPLLVCTKLALVQLGVMREWVRLIETRA